MLYMLFPINSPPGFNDQLSNYANDIKKWRMTYNGLIQIIFYVMPLKRHH